MITEVIFIALLLEKNTSIPLINLSQLVMAITHEIC